MSDKFEIAWARPSCLAFALHGMWDDRDMAQFDHAMRAAVSQAPAGPWKLRVDLTDFPPQNDAIQAGHQALMAFSGQQGCTLAVVIAPKIVTSMQIKRLSHNASAGHITFVATPQEADGLLAA